MLDPELRLRHLRCFLETARLGSLSAAAQALGVSQPAASKTIRELERILGKPLFDRTKRRLTLTPVGRSFQEHAGAALIELKRAQDLVRGTPDQAKRVAVGALPTASTELMPRAALAFRSARPDCLLRVSTGPNWLLMSQLREGALDMVVGRMASIGVMEGLTFRQLYSEPIEAIVRPDHPLLAQVDPTQNIGAYDLMLPPSGAVIAPVVRAYLSGLGTTALRPAFENVSLAFGRKVVQNSDTIWFISRGVIQNELEDGSLIALPLPGALLGGPVGVSMRETGVMSPELQEFLAALEAVAQAKSR